MYYVYKTTNIVNNKIYVGVHKSDNIQSDEYLGSGKVLNVSILKYGRDKFKRQILYEFKEENEAYFMQSQIVDNQFVKRRDTYNIKCGGWGGQVKGYVPVKDKLGQILYVSVKDSRYISGQLSHITTGQIVVKDSNGNIFSVAKDDPRYISGQVISITTGKIAAKDTDGNTFLLNKDDSRWVNGKLVGINKGYKFPAGHQLGQKNSQFGTIWITNGIQSKKIKIGQPIPQGYKRGRN